MRVLIFHGYLLAGTGSNVYNARLAQALARAGHEVHLVCQERHPERLAFVDAAADWETGELVVRPLRDAPEAGGCTIYRPDIGGLLPVYVADRYEALEARTFADCSEEEIARYMRANVAAVREVCERARPQLALANHLVMGPVILARALAGLPYAVKVHGSALEYTVKPEPRRFLPFAREGLAPAHGVLVGSRHTAESLWRALEDEELPSRTRLGPPGVEVETFMPRSPDAAAAGLSALAGELADAGRRRRRGARVTSAFERDPREASVAIARLAGGRGALVAYVGKLIVSKGLDLLLAGWPLVLEQVPDARLVIVGFGSYRAALERLAQALAAGDIEQARAIARAGRTLESAASSATAQPALAGQLRADSPACEPAAGEAPLRLLLAFLDGLQGSRRDSFLAAAARLPQSLLFTGRLEHDELAQLLPACDALAVPSTFPEAFGMVAAEAAACGALPVSAAHSGLAEVSEALAQAVPVRARRLLSFPLAQDAVEQLAERLASWLTADPRLRAGTREALVRAVRERWSWQAVAEGVLAAAEGRLERLAPP